MTKDELQAKRAVALSELKNIEVALCLDEHYIDIIEKENAELKNIERMAIYTKLSDQLAQAKELLERFLGLGNLWNLDCKDYFPLRKEVTQFLKEIEK